MVAGGGGVGSGGGGRGGYGVAGLNSIRIAGLFFQTIDGLTICFLPRPPLRRPR